jgi:AcrR family transcriptional regulator
MEARILDSALALFGRSGIAGASIEEIAADSGVTKRTIYRRYVNKAALLDAVVARDLAYLAAMLSSEDAPFAGPLDALRQSTERLFSYSVTPERARFLALLNAECARSAAMQAKLATWENLVLDPLMARVAAAQAAGQLRQGDPRVLCTILLDLLEGLALRIRSGGPRAAGIEPASAFNQRWETFLSGWEARPPRGNPG